MDDFQPGYVWPNPAIPFRLYYADNKCRIFIIENLTHNWKWLSTYRAGIRSTDFFFVLVGCHHGEWLVNKSRKMLDALNLDIQNFFILSNSNSDLENFRNAGFNTDLINQNAWLDESGPMRVINGTKCYDAIYVGRLIPVKRHQLASKVENLALVAGLSHGAKLVDPPPHIYRNTTPLTRDAVAEKINQSKVGLILSAEEGACYASSEYLLCGVPVVSTFSKGGRDVWYNDYNSFVCDDDPDAVANAVRTLVSEPRDPHKIREQHISQAKKYRARFVHQLHEVFERFRVSNVDAAAYFEDNFYDKMRKSYIVEFDQIFG